jgi:hypothetical protein
MRGHLLEYKGQSRSQKMQFVWWMGINPNLKVLYNKVPDLVRLPRTERLYKGQSRSQKVQFVGRMGIDPNLKALRNAGPCLVPLPQAERLYKGQSRWETEQG